MLIQLKARCGRGLARQDEERVVYVKLGRLRCCPYSLRAELLHPLALNADAVPVRFHDEYVETTLVVALTT
ncbi:MAG TPA: hypothetical protein VMU94_30420 [Streptosporangiaceae bacterium]|nr:hypothetical protein [Streptosporangiaceae bacterium]